MVKKRVLYIADCVSLQSGVGDLVHVREFVNILSKKKLDVTLIIRNGDSSNFMTNISIFKIPSLDFPLSIFTYLFSLIGTMLLTLITRPKFIYVRSGGINFPVFLGKLLRIPIFLEINGDLTKENLSMPKFLNFFVLCNQNKNYFFL